MPVGPNRTYGLSSVEDHAEVRMNVHKYSEDWLSRQVWLGRASDSRFMFIRQFGIQVSKDYGRLVSYNARSRILANPAALIR